jgi:hypothetical protein
MDAYIQGVAPGSRPGHPTRRRRGLFDLSNETSRPDRGRHLNRLPGVEAGARRLRSLRTRRTPGRPVRHPACARRSRRYCHSRTCVRRWSGSPADTRAAKSYSRLGRRSASGAVTTALMTRTTCPDHLTMAGYFRLRAGKIISLTVHNQPSPYWPTPTQNRHPARRRSLVTHSPARRAAKLASAPLAGDRPRASAAPSTLGPTDILIRDQICRVRADSIPAWRCERSAATAARRQRCPRPVGHNGRALCAGIRSTANSLAIVRENRGP